jgi:hypothetical protein
MVTGTFFVASGVDYTITVGSGGAGSVYSPGPGNISQSANGTNSSIVGTGISITSLGGVRAPRRACGAGGPGGSGGGGSGWGYPQNPSLGVGGSATQPAQSQTVGAEGLYTNYGNNGGGGILGGGGGGGGAGAIGGNATSPKGGDGGNGVAFSIVGTSTYYAGGGAGVINGSVPGSGTAGLGGGGTGGTSTVFSPLQNGVPGTGGGGGGGYATPTKNGGSGGPGIVVISYQG